jgi:uncharacterized protein YndB with AHSA1/START domain
MSADTAAIDAKVYNAAVGRATLRGIWMMESRFDLSPQALEVEPDVALAHTMRVHEAEVTVDADATVRGFIRFEAASRRRRRRVLHVSARYFVSYRVEGGCDQRLAEMFMDRVGKLAAYPYFRALVASLAAQAGAQVPTLPILSFRPRSIRYADDDGPANTVEF